MVDRAPRGALRAPRGPLFPRDPENNRTAEQRGPIKKLVSVVFSVSTGRAALAGEHLQNSANFEIMNLSQFLIVVELFGPHARPRCEVHFHHTNMLKILVSWVSTGAF